MRPLNDRQRAALLAFAGHGIVSRYVLRSVDSLIGRGFVSKRRTWEDGANGHVVYEITEQGKQLAEEILADRIARKPR